MIITNYKLGVDAKHIIFDATFSNNNFDADVGNDVFNYTPQTGVKVIDITNEIKSRKK